MLSEQDKQFLLKLARAVIEDKEVDIEDIPQSLTEKGATFISIYKEDKLVNSIGSITPTKEIFQDVLDNIIVLSQEIKEKEVKIEISLIKNIKKVTSETEEGLFSQIIPHRHGVTIEKNKRIATLLPFVWQQVHDKREFLNQICYKARLEKNEWKKNADIFIYETETFREK